MPEWLLWFTRFENSKVAALVLFFVAFCGIVIYVYTGEKRSKRLESYKYIPLQEDETGSNVAEGDEEHSDERSKN